MAAGSISADEFNRLAERFFSRSQQIGDFWQLRTISGEVFLCKKCVIKLNISPQPADASTGSSALTSEELAGQDLEDCEEDPASLPQDESQSAVRSFEYHVLYSHSYGVPVLYLNAHKPDGQLLSLEQMWQTIPSYYQQRLQNDRWTFLTQQEHPLLRQPFYQLHPCHTASLMEQVSAVLPTEKSHEKCDYLVSWLSSIAPVVHLNIPLQYAQT